MSDESAWTPPSNAAPEVPAVGAAPVDAAPSLPPAAAAAPSLPDAVPSLPVAAPPSPAAPPPSPWAPDGQPPTPSPPSPPAPPSPWAPGGQPAAAPPPVAPPVAPPASGPATPPPGPTPTVQPTSPTPPRRSNWLVAGAITAVIAVVAAGVFAIVNLTQSSNGGSASAAELGFELLEAIENEDVLGVVDLLLPGERDAFRGPLVDVASELTRLEVLSGDFDLSQLAGLDIEFEGESSVVRPTNVDDIVNVDLRATANVTVDGGELPIGDLLTDHLPDGAMDELRESNVTTSEELDISLTAVDHDGRWYFSAFHSIAEAARADFAPDSPIPATGVGSDGAESPEAAVDQLLDRVEQLDLTGLIRALHPGEAAALQRYAPLFIDDAQAELDAAPFEWTITERDIRVEGSGDRRTAFVDAIAIEGVIDGSPFEASAGGSCYSASFEGETFEQCGAGLADADEMLAELPAVRELLDTVTDAFADIEPVGLELREGDDGWYVSLTATASEAILAVLRALDRAELDAIITAAGDAFAELFGVAFGDITDALEGELTLDEPGLGDVFDDLEATVGGGSSDLDEVADAWFACAEESEAAVAAACFDVLVRSGDLDVGEVPIELRYPECGYAEAAWSGAIYELPDDEFIALATAASQCFLEKVDRGEIEAWELPSEITHLECFEGRNWYNVFDDPEYDERYYACISAAFDG